MRRCKAPAGAGIAVGILLAALVASGCDSSVEPGTPPGAGHTARLIIGVAQDAGPLNIYTSDARFDFLVELVYDKLFAPSPYVDSPRPWLADTATAVDAETWDVTLRRGVKWQDGEAFTAADVKFTFEYFRDGPANRYTHHVSEVPRIDEVEALADYRLRFRCATPCPTLRDVTMADLPILPKHIWQGVTEPRNFSAMPIGTGPYKLVGYSAGQRYRFEANRNYFMGAPTVDELVFPVIPDQSTMFVALRTGEIDASARPLPPELLKQFQRSAEIKVVRTQALSIVELRINYERAPLNDPSVRLALSLAIDRQALVDTVLLGRGRAASHGYPHPDSPWTNPKNSASFDRQRAGIMLSEAGLVDRDGDGIRESPTGRKLAFTLKVAATEPAQLRIAELLARQFASAGVSLAVESEDQTAITKLFGSREFELYLAEIGPHGVADPDQFVVSQGSGYLWKKGLPYPEMDALTKEYIASSGKDARLDVLFRMQTLFNQRPTSFALYYPEEHWAFRRGAFDKWVESAGYGIVNKWSFLSSESRQGVIVRDPGP
ncbi:MAG: ABC transporter substrate-binding protein [Tepidiformaceae bacterium]